MPPFRDGLKRKTAVADKDIKDICSSIENVEFGSGAVDDGEGDGTDEESDTEEDDQILDEVVFGSDVDSTLGEEDPSLHQDSSEELSDSQEEDSDDEESDDSGAAVTGDDRSEASEDSSDKPKNTAKTKEIVPRNSKSNKMEGNSKSKGINKTSKTDKNASQESKGVNKASKIDRSISQEKKQQDTTIEPQTEKVVEYGVDDPDTSDEEGCVVKTGTVPRWWYSEYPHVGYDLEGRRVMRPPQGDLLDTFLRKAEDPDFWRTVTDPVTQQEVVLSEEDLQLLKTLREGRAPGDLATQYPRWEDWFTGEVLQTPVRAFPDHKRSFLPSKTEQRQISRLVHALNMGWIKTRKELAQERKRNKEKHFYDLWGSAASPEVSSMGRSLPAPRRPLPGHGDSYRPPPEYLPSPDAPAPPWAPKSVTSLRLLPAYPRYIRDRFLRCLDLYLAPRAIKMKVQVRAEDLVPSLPSPRDLQPFPTSESVVYRGHSGAVRSVAVSPCGQYAVSGGDDGDLRIWEIDSGRSLRAVTLGGAVSRVMWAPSGLCLVLAMVGDKVVLINPGGHIGDHNRAEQTDLLLKEAPPQHDIQPDARVSGACTWEEVDSAGWARGVRLSVRHVRDVTHADWHVKGDYIAAVTHEPAARALVVHQISRRRSQLPLSRHRGLIQCVSFHPHRPFLFVATQRNVRVYDLLKRELVKKLTTGAQYISSMAVHPGGDNLLVGSFDRKSIWFDLDLSSAPYQTLKVVGGAVRAVAHHRRYPLWAAGGDGGHVAVCHGRVYQDLTQCPLLVPLKRLSVPKRGDLSALDLTFHPTQPWLLVALADHTIRLYT